MNEITYNHIIGTWAQVVIAGLMISTGFSDKIPDKSHVDIPPSQTEYTPALNQRSFFQNSSSTLEIKNAEYDDFEKSIGVFYTRLLANQEPLGKEFEEVLYKNLWDLYES